MLRQYEYMKYIRNPLYGYIDVTDAELSVIGMPAVQRLRCIQQLGLSSAVYPGATHSRFEHSLGVMHLAGRLSESLGLSERETQAYRLAGLLHDVGHAPFSHATEAIVEDELGLSHEDQSCRIVRGIANALGDEFEADPDLVIDAIRGEAQYNIIAGDVDVDRLDYLRRDAIETDIPHGEIDTDTIIRFAQLRDGDVVFSYKALEAIQSMFSARASMNVSVYQHHTSRIVETMLRRAVMRFFTDTEYDPTALLQWDDRQLHCHLLEYEGLATGLYGVSEGEDGSLMAPTASVADSGLYGRISTRNLYKRAKLIGVNDIGYDGLKEIEQSVDDPITLEREIAEDADVDPESVLVELPRTPSNQLPDVGILMDETVEAFSELSSLPYTLSESEWRTTYLGVYTAPSQREQVGRVVASMFE